MTEYSTPFDVRISDLKAKIKNTKEVHAAWWRRKDLERFELQRNASIQAVKETMAK